jgi:3-isopropylmalate/(R)-2-methylmalate dehydratase small subunit
LLDFGIRCVIAPSFADIFFNNCFKNGILPIVLPHEQVDLLLKEAGNAPDPTFTIDLQAQEIRRPTGNEPIPFNIDPGNRDKLLQGLDEVGETLRRADRIDRYEATLRQQFPWLQRQVA